MSVYFRILFARVAIFLPFCALLLPLILSAEAEGFNAIFYRPAIDNTRYFSVWESDSLKDLQILSGISGVYAWRPLQFTNGDAYAREIVKSSELAHLYWAIGIPSNDQISFGIECPLGGEQFLSPESTKTTPDFQFVLGDPRVYLKITGRNAKTDGTIGFAFLPFFDIPAGYSNKFVGSQFPSGGLQVIADLAPTERWGISVNWGAQFGRTYRLTTLEISNQMLFKAGTVFLLDRHLSTIFELSMKTNLTSPFSEKIDTPSEFLGGLRYAIGSSGVDIGIGGGMGILGGAEAATWRTFSDLRIHF